MNAYINIRSFDFLFTSLLWRLVLMYLFTCVGSEIAPIFSHSGSHSLSVDKHSKALDQRSQGNHSRVRVDEMKVSPKHAKKLLKSRKYQAKKRLVTELISAGVTDQHLQEMILSKEGQEKFPETSALIRENKCQASAAKAIQAVVKQLPKKSAHKKAIVGKLRGRMTAKEWQHFFTNISDRYARKAAQATKAMEASQARGEKLKQVDIFSHQVVSDAKREGIDEFEKRIITSHVMENLSAKSGSNALFWYGNLDSFWKWYRTEAHPNIYKQMCEEAGGWKQLVMKMGGGQWVTQNTAAYLCQGRCVPKAGEEVCPHFYKPRNPATVRKIFKEKDLHFRSITKTVPCQWHDNWEKWKKQLAREKAKPDHKRNGKKIRKLQSKVEKCKRHDAQFQVQRGSLASNVPYTI